MSLFLGIDTSNYTTSAAIFNSVTGEIRQERTLLSVKNGEKGLRQSDALFAHIKNLPSILSPLLSSLQPTAVGVSVRPRDLEGSYMPCFEAGVLAAKSISLARNIPCFEFSHQAGHIASALFSIGRMDLLHTRIIAFHVSGGTTEAVLSHFDGKKLDTELLAKSLDLKAGQAVDRVGQMLGLPFPSGPKLEQLALQSSKTFEIKPTMKGADCCLSGLENLCRKMIDSACDPSDVALYCLEYIKVSLEGMLKPLALQYPGVPVLFAGGVMSNSIIRDYFTEKYDALFAKPAFSTDNAAGIAVLTKSRIENG